MLYRFDCKTTYKDYYEFNKYHMIDSPEGKKGILVGRLYVPAIFLAMLVYYMIKGDEWYLLLSLFVSYGVVSIIWAFSVVPLSLLLLKLRLKSMQKRGKLPYSDFATLEFYDEYFVETTKNTKTEIQYNAVHKTRINEPKAIYIYQNTVLAYIVPFDVFGSDEEREKFIDFIYQKTNK